jgi:hypothetical protein
MSALPPKADIGLRRAMTDSSQEAYRELLRLDRECKELQAMALPSSLGLPDQ